MPLSYLPNMWPKGNDGLRFTLAVLAKLSLAGRTGEVTMAKSTHGSYHFVTNEELDDLHEGKFVLICPAIELTKYVGEQIVNANGPGKIWVGADGKIYFEIFWKWSDLDVIRQWQERSIIRREKISATDSWGRIWQSEHAYEDFEFVGHHFSPSGFSIIRGTVLDLLYEPNEPLINEPKPDWLELRYHFDGDLPFNESTDINETSMGRTTSLGWRMNVLQFHIETYQITLKYGEVKKLLTVTIKSENGLIPDIFEKRFTQCLQFVCGRIMLRYFKRQRYANRLTNTIVHIDQRKNNLKTAPPVSQNIGEHENFLSLFIRYWNFISQDSDIEWHPISGLMQSILFTGDALLETQILTLCTALEGLSSFIDGSDIEVLSPEIKGFYRDLQREYENIFDERAKSPKLDKDKLDRLRSRILGAIKQIDQPTAGAKLNAFTNRNVLTTEQVEVWKSYRNRLAHGNKLEKTGQELYEAKLKLLTAFYRIIFHLCGYTGESIAYG